MNTLGFPTLWTALGNSAASTATQASASQAAVTTLRHTCTSITCTVATGATAQTPLQFVLRDGATGAGTVIWSGALSAPANSSASLVVSGINLLGTKNTAMTLESAAAPVAAAVAITTLVGFDQQ